MPGHVTKSLPEYSWSQFLSPEWDLWLFQDPSSVPELVPVYSVNPDRAQIAPKSSCQVEFFGFSATAGQFQEHFICSLGSGAKSKQNVFDFIAE